MGAEGGGCVALVYILNGIEYQSWGGGDPIKNFYGKIHHFSYALSQ